jgi:cytochrome c oxidase assembly protein subunit 11
LPEEYEPYFTSIQCFCFIQQTLDPGETIDMKLIFRLDYNIPADVRQLENKYVFYDIESFPEEDHHDE